MSDEQNIIDAKVNSDGRAEEEKSLFDTCVDWVKNHKVICILGVIFFPITLIVIGAKLFSTQTTIEIEKEVAPPSCTDGYKKVPVSTYVETHYDWVPEKKSDPEE